MQGLSGIWIGASLWCLSFACASGREPLPWHAEVWDAVDAALAGDAARVAEMWDAVLEAEPGLHEAVAERALLRILANREAEMTPGAYAALADVLWGADGEVPSKVRRLKTVGVLYEMAGGFDAFLDGLMASATDGGDPGRYRAALYLSTLYHLQLDYRSAQRWYRSALEAPRGEDGGLWEECAKVSPRVASATLLENLAAQELAGGLLEPESKLDVLAVGWGGDDRREALFRYWHARRPWEWLAAADAWRRRSEEDLLFAVGARMWIEGGRPELREPIQRLVVAQGLYEIGEGGLAVELLESVLALPVAPGTDSDPEVNDAGRFPKADQRRWSGDEDTLRLLACLLIEDAASLKRGERVAAEIEGRPQMSELRRLLWMRSGRVAGRSKAARELLESDRWAALDPVMRAECVGMIDNGPVGTISLRTALDRNWDTALALCRREPFDLRSVLAFADRSNGSDPRLGRGAAVAEAIWERERAGDLSENEVRAFHAWLESAPTQIWPQGVGIDPPVPGAGRHFGRWAIILQGERESLLPPGNNALWEGFLSRQYFAATRRRMGASVDVGGYSTGYFKVGPDGVAARGGEDSRFVRTVADTFRFVGGGLDRPRHVAGEWVRPEPGDTLRELESWVERRPEDVHLQLILAQVLLLEPDPRFGRKREPDEEGVGRARRALALLDSMPGLRGWRAEMVKRLRKLAAEAAGEKELAERLAAEIEAIEGEPVDCESSGWDAGLVVDAPPIRYVPLYKQIGVEKATALWLRPLPRLDLPDEGLQAAATALAIAGEIPGLLTELDAGFDSTADPVELRFRIYLLRRALQKASVKRPADHAERAQRDLRLLVQNGEGFGPAFLAEAASLLAEEDPPLAVVLLARAFAADPGVALDSEGDWVPLLEAMEPADLEPMAGACLAYLEGAVPEREGGAGSKAQRAIERRKDRALAIAGRLEEAEGDTAQAVRLAIAALVHCSYIGVSRDDLEPLRGRLDAEQAMTLARALLLAKVREGRHQVVERGGFLWRWGRDGMARHCAGFTLMEIVAEAGAAEEFWYEESQWIEERIYETPTPLVAELLAGGIPDWSQHAARLSQDVFLAVGASSFVPARGRAALLALAVERVPLVPPGAHLPGARLRVLNAWALLDTGGDAAQQVRDLFAHVEAQPAMADVDLAVWLEALAPLAMEVGEGDRWLALADGLLGEGGGDARTEGAVLRALRGFGIDAVRRGMETEAGRAAALLEPVVARRLARNTPDATLQNLFVLLAASGRRATAEDVAGRVEDEVLRGQLMERLDRPGRSPAAVGAGELGSLGPAAEEGVRMAEHGEGFARFRRFTVTPGLPSGAFARADLTLREGEGGVALRVALNQPRAMMMREICVELQMLGADGSVVGSKTAEGSSYGVSGRWVEVELEADSTGAESAAVVLSIGSRGAKEPEGVVMIDVGGVVLDPVGG